MSLTPMIGVTGENLLSAIELFEQHPSDQQMGPGQRPKREDYLGAVENGFELVREEPHTSPQPAQK